MNNNYHLRADNTFLIEGYHGDNPKLMGRVRRDGRVTLYLEYYYGKMPALSRHSRETYQKNCRKNELLKLYLYRSPDNKDERQHNRQSISLARKLRREREQQLLERERGYRLPTDPVNLIDWMNDFYRAYNKGDARHILRACRCFSDFLSEHERGARFNGFISPSQLTPGLVDAFTIYLRRRFRGEGPHTLYARFKKIIKAAVEAGIIARNPCSGVSIKIDDGVLRKDVLGNEEVTRLIATHIPQENHDIRRAFIFSLYTGVRWCDVIGLTYRNVDRENRMLRFVQVKTRGTSSSSAVVIPLSPSLLTIIGESGGDRDRLIFPLPSRRTCQSALRRWVTAAGIDKHITWHCARHSFAVNILNNGANIKTVASLLGHSSLRHTEKYTRAIDSLKRQAIMSLPPLPEEY